MKTHQEYKDHQTKTSIRVIKKSINIRWNSKLFFQLSLIVCLLLAYFAIHTKFDVKEQAKFSSDIEILEEIPMVTYVLESPKPKPVSKKVTVKTTSKPTIIKNIKKVDDNTSIETKTIGEEPNLGKKNTESVNTNNDKTPAKVERSTYNLMGVEHVPIFPGCEKLNTNLEKSNCMSQKIKRFVQRKFNSNTLEDLQKGKSHTVHVQFYIDEQGEVTQIKARAHEKLLEKEAIRVVSKLPSMQPGIQGDKKVKVQYTLPITFKIDY